MENKREFQLGDIVSVPGRATQEPYIFLHKIHNYRPLNGDEKSCSVLISLRDDHSLNVITESLTLIATAEQLLETYKYIGISK